MGDPDNYLSASCTGRHGPLHRIRTLVLGIFILGFPHTAAEGKGTICYSADVGKRFGDAELSMRVHPLHLCECEA